MIFFALVSLGLVINFKGPSDHPFHSQMCKTPEYACIP